MSKTKQSDQRPRPWERGAESEAGSFGGWLRRQREVRGITLREIADASKISFRYLEALEQDRFELLPAPVFARGFLREYARYVGLNPDEVVNFYLIAQGSGETPEEPVEVVSPPRRNRSRAWGYAVALSAAIVVFLGGAALLSFYAEKKRAAQIVEVPPMAPPAELSAAPPEVAAPAESASPEGSPGPDAAGASANPASAPLRVTLSFDQDCWVEAQTDDHRLLSELHAGGELLELEAQRSVVLTLGNPAAVSVEVNGRPFALPPTAGQILRDLRIELATVPGSSEGT